MTGRSARLADEFMPGPVNWNELGPGQAAEQWCALDAWVTWLRRGYGISTLEIPPFWPDAGPDRILTDRDADFRATVNADVAYRDAVLAANVAILADDGA